MSKVIQSFSGAHPFRPQCIIDAIVDEWALEGLVVTERANESAATITLKIDGGTCPRCDGPLDLGRSAGSRMTRCRCVPICETCGGDETNQGIRGRGVSQTWRWPLRKGDITRRRDKALKGFTLMTGVMVGGDDGEAKMLTEAGVSELVMRPNPSGWAEFGFDDTEDQAERNT
jgi:hypothetical protein